MSSDSSSFSFGSRQMSDDGMLDNPALYDGVLGRRFWAYIVDVLLISIANLAVHVALITMGIVTFGLLLLPAMAIMAVISFLPLAILYDTITMGGYKASTPGMRLFDLAGPQQRRPASARTTSRPSSCRCCSMSRCSPPRACCCWWCSSPAATWRCTISCPVSSSRAESANSVNTYPALAERPMTAP